MNEVLTESKKHAIVVNNLFHSIQDFVGFKSLDEPSVLEPLFPTQYFIAHESIETNRREVSEDLKPGSVHFSRNNYFQSHPFPGRDYVQCDRLGYFLKVLVTNLGKFLAQILGKFLALVTNGTFYIYKRLCLLI